MKGNDGGVRTAQLLVSPAVGMSDVTFGIHWKRLECEIEVSVAARTRADYEVVTNKLNQLRFLALENSYAEKFNTLLTDFRKRHQSKSMLISMVNRSVFPIEYK